jgi:ubiquinone/menaquinone biosynthesis C-methylase UbiE
MSFIGELQASGSPDKQRSYAAVPPGTRTLLDVGCGSGDDVLALAERLGSGALVVGVDASLESIEEAMRKARNVALNVRFAVGDARCLPFDHGSFEVVWADGLFGAASDADGIARELTRVTGPAGRLLVRDRESALIDEPNERDVIGLLKRYGLASVTITGAWSRANGERQLSLLAHKAARV